MKVKITSTVLLKCYLPLSHEMHLVSLETSLISLDVSLVSVKKFLVSHECTVSMKALPSSECTNSLVL